MEYNKATNLKANGTCFQGNILATYFELEKVFGEPIFPNSGDGKVICEWVLEWDDGTISTIYCWKVKEVPMEEYKWHIGGHSKKAVENILKYFEIQNPK